MGKSDAPPTPDYKGQAIATSNSGKYNEVGPTGSVGWSLRPGADPNNPQPGDYIRTTEMSPEQRQLYDQGVGNQLALGDVGQRQIADLGGGTQQMQDALYRRATQYYDQNFGDQGEALRTQLLNSGLAEGSEGYDKAMRNFGQTRDTAYADATDRAIVGADQSQNSAVSRLAQIMAMSRGQNPTSSNSAGGAGIDLLSAAMQEYNSKLAGVNANNAQAANQAQTAQQLGMLAYLFG